MVRRIPWLVALAVVLVFSGSAHSEPSSTASSSVPPQDPTASQSWEELVKAAQEEGQVELVLGGQMPLKLRKAMPAFEKKYGIKVNFHTGGGRALAARMLAERAAGRFTLDVRIGGANTALVQLLPNNALAPIDSLLVHPEVTAKSLWFNGRHYYVDPEGRYILAWGASPVHQFSYNTNLVDPADIKSYWDMLDPKWKGKIVSWSPAAQGTAATSVPMFLNPKIGEEWFRRWANEMDVTIVSDPRQGAEWVAMGRFPIGMFGLNTQADALDRQGFPIKGYLPHQMEEGNIISSSAANIMVMDKAPNPNAAKLFVNWALSREAQQLFVEVGETTDSLRSDIDDSVIAEQYRLYSDRDYIVAFAEPEYVNRQSEILSKMQNIMREAGYQ